MPKGFILEKSEHFFVTCARAPYIRNHLLVIPNRHVVLFNTLSWEEIQDLMKLVAKRDSILHKKHSDVALLLRDWSIGWKGGKSVDHMHFHLIPDLEITAKDNSSGIYRKYLTEKEVLQRVASMKKMSK